MKVPLTGIVALAFADASIVALALPAIYRRFDTTIVGVSWVLTGYAVAVTVAALAVVVARRWLRPVPLTVAGLALFAAGSTWCGLAGSLASLLAGRVAQGIGAAALLAGALELLVAEAGRERGRSLWSGAATAGLAVGPALGGALTEAFDWRVIFLVQVPVAVLVLAALVVRRPRAAAEAEPEAPVDGRAIWATTGYVTLFAGLVGALFLGVLLLVEIWRFSPVVAALVVMALPAGTVLVGRLTAGAGPATRVVAGSFALSAGLLALAFLPAANAAWAAAALFLCGAGYGVVARALAAVALGSTEPGALRGATGPDSVGGQDRSERSEPAGSALPNVRAGGLVVAAKHAGLVLGLVLIAPLLAGTLTDGSRQAVVTGTGVLLDARMPVQDKLRLAVSVRDTFASASRGSVPDLDAAVGEAGRSAAATAVVDEVEERLTAVLTRAFRPAFAAAAGLAILTVLAAFAVRQPRGYGRRRAFPVAVLGVLVLLGPAVVGAEAAAGARDYGRYAETDPCAAPADSYPGEGVDALVQRVAYGALHGAACDLGMSRERFLLALAGEPGFADGDWDPVKVEQAVRGAVDQALDDVEERGEAPALTITLVREAVKRLSLEEILELVGLR